MKWGELANLVQGTLVCGYSRATDDVLYAFASDLMSDVLTLQTEKFMLVTGLMNLQTIRTCEMADICWVMLVRNKKASPEVVRLANENGISIIESPFSMFRACTVLGAAKLKPVY